MALSGATIPSLSGPGSVGNEGVLLIPQSSSSEAALNDIVSKSSAKKQVVYSTDPVDWTDGISYVLLLEMV